MSQSNPHVDFANGVVLILGVGALLALIAAGNALWSDSVRDCTSPVVVQKVAARSPEALDPAWLQPPIISDKTARFKGRSC